MLVLLQKDGASSAKSSLDCMLIYEYIIQMLSPKLYTRTRKALQSFHDFNDETNLPSVSKKYLMPKHLTIIVHK